MNSKLPTQKEYNSLTRVRFYLSWFGISVFICVFIMGLTSLLDMISEYHVNIMQLTPNETLVLVVLSVSMLGGYLLAKNLAKNDV